MFGEQRLQLPFAVVDLDDAEAAAVVEAALLQVVGGRLLAARGALVDGEQHSVRAQAAPQQREETGQARRRHVRQPERERDQVVAPRRPVGEQVGHFDAHPRIVAQAPQRQLQRLRRGVHEGEPARLLQQAFAPEPGAGGQLQRRIDRTQRTQDGIGARVLGAPLPAPGFAFVVAPALVKPVVVLGRALAVVLHLLAEQRVVVAHGSG